jgi:hypothetical protein
MHRPLTKETISQLYVRLHGNEVIYKLTPELQVSCWVSEREEMEELMTNVNFPLIVNDPYRIGEISMHVNIPLTFKVINTDPATVETDSASSLRRLLSMARADHFHCHSTDQYEFKNPLNQGYDYSLYLTNNWGRGAVKRRTLRTNTSITIYPRHSNDCNGKNKAIQAVIKDIEEKGMSEFFSPGGR